MRVLIILLGALLNVWGHAAEPPSRTGVGEHAPSVASEGNGTAKNEKEPVAPLIAKPIEVRIIENKSDAEHTEKREKNSDKHEADDLKAQQDAANAAIRSSKTNDRQLITSWLSICITLIGTIIAAIGTFFVVRAFKDSQRAADAAVRAAQAAEASVTAMQSHAEMQLRAYIGINQVGVMGLEDDNPVGVGFYFINHGQTHAKDFNFQGVVDLLPYPLPDNYVLESPPQRVNQDGIVFPQGDTTPMQGWVWERVPMTRQEKLGIFNKGTKKQIYAHGTVSYTDIFNNKRVTTFCIFLNHESIEIDAAGNIVRNQDGSIKFMFSPAARLNKIE